MPCLPVKEKIFSENSVEFDEIRINDQISFSAVTQKIAWSFDGYVLNHKFDGIYVCDESERVNS